MAINNWEFAYNGLTFGGANDIGVTSVTGLSPANARIDEVEKAGDHGSYIFAQFLEARTITIEGDVTGISAIDFESKINLLRAAFIPQLTPQPLQMAVPGDVQKLAYCVPTKIDFPIDISYQTFYETWTVEFMAEDPRIYSNATNVVDIYPAIPNGISFNFVFSINFGGTSGGSLTQSATNNGTFPSPPVVLLHGPMTNPVLTNLTTGKYMRLAISIGELETLTLDFYAKTAILNNLSSRYSSVVPGSSWWPLQPGANTVRLSADGITSNSKATVTYRDAWN
jgi:Siphovirus-type tail component, C-terminal domain/Phage tail protein RIFT-related domain